MFHVVRLFHPYLPCIHLISIPFAYTHLTKRIYSTMLGAILALRFALYFFPRLPIFVHSNRLVFNCLHCKELPEHQHYTSTVPRSIHIHIRFGNVFYFRLAGSAITMVVASTSDSIHWEVLRQFDLFDLWHVKCEFWCDVRVRARADSIFIRVGWRIGDGKMTWNSTLLVAVARLASLKKREIIRSGDAFGPTPRCWLLSSPIEILWRAWARVCVELTTWVCLGSNKNKRKTNKFLDQ